GSCTLAAVRVVRGRLGLRRCHTRVTERTQTPHTEKKTNERNQSDDKKRSTDRCSHRNSDPRQDRQRQGSGRWLGSLRRLAHPGTVTAPRRTPCPASRASGARRRETHPLRAE